MPCLCRTEIVSLTQTFAGAHRRHLHDLISECAIDGMFRMSDARIFTKQYYDIPIPDVGDVVPMPHAHPHTSSHKRMHEHTREHHIGIYANVSVIHKCTTESTYTYIHSVDRTFYASMSCVCVRMRFVFIIRP